MRAPWEIGAGRPVFVCFISAYATKTQTMGGWIIYLFMNISSSRYSEVQRLL